MSQWPETRLVPPLNRDSLDKRYIWQLFMSMNVRCMIQGLFQLYKYLNKPRK